MSSANLRIPDTQYLVAVRCRSLPAALFPANASHTSVAVFEASGKDRREVDRTERVRDLASPAFQKQLAVKVDGSQDFVFVVYSHSGAVQDMVGEFRISGQELISDLGNELDSILTHTTGEAQRALLQSTSRLIIRPSKVGASSARLSAEQEFALVTEGRNVFIYSPDGTAVVNTLKYKPGLHDMDMGTLVWGPLGKAFPRENVLEVAHITDMLEGKQSRALLQHSARTVADDTCFTVLASNPREGGVRSLDASAESPAVRDAFLNSLHAVLTQGVGKDVSVMEKANVVVSPAHKAPPAIAALGSIGGSFLAPLSFKARQGIPVEREISFQCRNLGEGFNSVVALFDKQGNDIFYVDQTELAKNQRDPNFKRPVYVQHYQGQKQEFKVSVYEVNEEGLPSGVEQVLDLRNRDVVGWAVVSADELVASRAAIKYLTHTVESNREWLEHQKAHVVIRTAESMGSHAHAPVPRAAAMSAPAPVAAAKPVVAVSNSNLNLGAIAAAANRSASKRDIHIRPSTKALLAVKSAASLRTMTPVDVLRKGQDFTKYPHKGGLLNEPQPRRVFFSPDPKSGILRNGSIYWCKVGRGNVMVRERSLQVAKIADVVSGKNTGPFKRSNAGKAVNEKRCFSILAGSRSLDLAAPSEQIRDLWVQCLRALLGNENLERPVLRDQAETHSPPPPAVVAAPAPAPVVQVSGIPRHISVKCRHLTHAFGRAVNPTVVVFDARSGDSIARTERQTDTENPDFAALLVVPHVKGGNQALKFGVYDSEADAIEAHHLVGHATELLDELVSSRGEVELQLANDRNSTFNKALQTSQSTIVLQVVEEPKIASMLSGRIPAESLPRTTETFIAVMREGRPFTYFTPKGPKIVDVYYLGGSAHDMGALFWSEPNQREGDRRHAISLAEVTDLFEGKQREGLSSSTKGAVDDHFWSVVTDKIVWDLEAANTFDRDCFLEGVHAILSARGVPNSVKDKTGRGGAAAAARAPASSSSSSEGSSADGINWPVIRNSSVTVFSMNGAPQRATLAFSATAKDGGRSSASGWIVATLADQRVVEIPLHEVTDLFEGRQTQAFSYAAASKAVEDHCFSVEAQKQVLDVECISRSTRDAWVSSLHVLLTTGGKQFAEMVREAKHAEETSSAQKLPMPHMHTSSSASSSSSPPPQAVSAPIALSDGPRYTGTPIQTWVSVKCRNLIQMDNLTSSDPLVAVNDVYTGRLLAQTEWLEETLNPVFDTRLPLDYYADQEHPQLLKFVVYDVENNQITENGRMGFAIVGMDELMSRNGEPLELELKFPEKPQLHNKLKLKGATIIIASESQPLPQEGPADTQGA